jgi:two-component system, OmpR family, copper resistance phosphate regulon response regulator CusR
VLTPQGAVITRPGGDVHRGGHRVLVVDDEARLRDVLVRILRHESIEAHATADTEQALAMARTGNYDLVILDLLMPDADGFGVLSEIINRKPEQAVLVLSCLSDPDSKMAALGLGADDYLAKPFHVGELVARVHARLRATARRGPAVLRHGRITLDVAYQRADSGSGPVRLTRRECQLLWELMREPGTVLPREELLVRVWGGDPGYAANVVDVYIGRLRQRLGRDAVVTVRGKGYRV